MKRSNLIAGLGACAAIDWRAAFAGELAPGASATIDDVLAPVPAITERSWVQFVMGSGVVYSKKIGFGRERTSLGTLPYIETQIGDAQATCNPNTIKKAYLDNTRYGDLLAPHDVKLYVVKAGTAFSILNTDASDKLYLLDEDNLYTRARGRVVASADDTVTMHGRKLACRRVELAFTHGATSLRTLTLWRSDRVPFGIARMHATLADSEPFDLRVDAFGDAYFSLVPESLDALRKASA